MGIFILTSLGPSITKTDFLNYIAALDYLSQKSIRLAPKILNGVEGCLYTQMGNDFAYIVEYIDGRSLMQNPDDEYKLGQATALLHSFKNYSVLSRLKVKETIEMSYNKFTDCPYKNMYYKLIASFPDLYILKQSFIHTDIAPHNAIMKMRGPYTQDTSLFTN